MPINNIQYRAEIGLFYNALQGFHFLTRSHRRTFCLDIMSTEIRKIRIRPGSVCPSFCYLISFIILLLMSPIILLYSIVIPKSFNLYKRFIVSYMYIYVCFYFTIKILRFTSTYRQYAFKLILKYFFFVQVCIFVPYIRMALIISGDIEVNPAPKTTCNQNISLCR